MIRKLRTAAHTIAFVTTFVCAWLLLFNADLFTLGTACRAALVAVCIGTQLYTLPTIIEKF